MKKNGLVYYWVMSFFALIMVSESSFAQDTASSGKPWIQKGWSIGAHFGSNLSYGDVRQYSLYPVGKYENERKWGYGLNIGKELNPIIDMRLQVLMGSLAGVIRPSKKYTKDPNNIYFNTNMFEVNANAKINISNIISQNDERAYNFYTYLGAGMNSFTSNLNTLTTRKSLKSYSDVAVVFPVGLGLDYAVSPSIKVNIDASLRFTTSDLLDGLESTFRGGNDKYGYTSIGVTYLFGKSKKKEQPKVVEQPIKEQVVEPVKEDSVKIAVDSLVKDSAELKAAALVKSNQATLSQTEETKIDTTAKITETESKPQPKVETVAEVKPEPTPEVKHEPVAEVKHESKPTPEPKIEKDVKSASKEKTSKSKSNSKSQLVVEFRVQITAMHQIGFKKVNRLKKQYNITEPIVEEHIDGWYKYTVGSYPNIEEAQKLKDTFIAKGRTDVFIVAYNNGQRVTIDQAKALLKK